MKTAVKVVLVLVLLIAAGLIFILFWNFDSPELGQKVLKTASGATGIQLNATGFKFNVRKGLFVNDLQATGNFEGGHYEAQLGKLILEHELWPLFRGDIVIKRVELEKPDINVVMVERTPKEPKPASEKEHSGKPTQEAEITEKTKDKQLSFRIDKVLLSDGSITIQQKGVTNGKTELKGIKISLQDITTEPMAQSLLQGLSAQGDFWTKEIDTASLKISDVAGKLTANQGQFELKDLSLMTDYGELKASTTVNFNANPFVYQITFLANKIDLNKLTDSREGFGPASLDFSGNGFGVAPKDLKGTGSLKLEKGNLPDHDALVQVENILGRPGLAGAVYQPTTVPYSIENGQITIKQFSLESEQIGVNLSGWVNLENQLHFNMNVQTPRAGIKIRPIPDQVFDVIADDKGWIQIPMALSGTTKNPKVVPDVSAIMAAAGHGAKREQQQKAQESINKALGKAQQQLKKKAKPH
jgi:uncharacterized protein involved in outer membrane biogenesis